MEMKTYQPGSFCWHELATTDGEAARRFYTGLFGWQVDDVPLGDGEVYGMLKKEGREVGALFKMGERMKGMPPHWGAYVAVESADESAKKAESLGARVLMQPFDVMDVGRMAALMDPTGATFAVWQAKKHQGAGVIYEPNTVCWNELMSRNVDVAAGFYTKLFGWTAKAEPMGPMVYTLFRAGDRDVGGMMDIGGPEHAKTPSHWLTYFGVENSDKAFERARSLGATALMPVTPIPKVGRFAIFTDPQGAAFGIIDQVK